MYMLCISMNTVIVSHRDVDSVHTLNPERKSDISIIWTIWYPPVGIKANGVTIWMTDVVTHYITYWYTCTCALTCMRKCIENYYNDYVRAVL